MLQRKHPAIFTCHRREFHWVNKRVALARKTREKNSVRTNGMFVRRVRKPRGNVLRWRREKKSCSRWTDLLPIYHRVEIRTEASARNRWQKFPLSRRLNGNKETTSAFVGPLTKVPKHLLDYYSDEGWWLPLPFRHGSFVIYWPLRFDVIEIFGCSFEEIVSGVSLTLYRLYCSNIDILFVGG